MFYDSEAVKMPAAESSISRWQQDVEAQTGSDRANAGAKTNGPMKAVGGPRRDKQRGHSRRHQGFNDRWDQMTKAEQQANGRLLRNYDPDLSPTEIGPAHFYTPVTKAHLVCPLLLEKQNS